MDKTIDNGKAVGIGVEEKSTAHEPSMSQHSVHGGLVGTRLP